jgi:hypothetical protein
MPGKIQKPHPVLIKPDSSQKSIFFSFPFIDQIVSMARGGKKEKNLGINPKNVQAFERLSYLHQAAILMSTIKYDTVQADSTTTTSNAIQDQWQGDPKGTLHATSRYLNNNIRQITGKLVMRM